MKWVVRLSILCVFGGLVSVGAAQESQPDIESFRFGPARVRHGDDLQYTFAYKNFPGGLAAVKDVEMWVYWQRPGDRAVRSRLCPIVRSLKNTQPTAARLKAGCCGGVRQSKPHAEGLTCSAS